MSAFTSYHSQGSKRPQSPVTEYPTITFLSEVSEPSSKRLRFADLDGDDDLEEVDQLTDDTDSTEIPPSQAITIDDELQKLQVQQNHSYLHIQDPKQALKRPRILQIAPCNPGLAIPPPAPIFKEVTIASIAVESPTTIKIVAPKAVNERHRFYRVNSVSVLKSNLKHLIKDVETLRVTATLSLSIESESEFEGLGVAENLNVSSNGGFQSEDIVIDIPTKDDAFSQNATQVEKQVLGSWQSSSSSVAESTDCGIDDLRATNVPPPAVYIQPGYGTTTDDLNTNRESDVVQSSIDEEVSDLAPDFEKLGNTKDMNFSRSAVAQDHFALHLFGDQFESEEEMERCRKNIQRYEQQRQLLFLPDEEETVPSSTQEYDVESSTAVAQVPTVDPASIVVPKTLQMTPMDLTEHNNSSPINGNFVETGSQNVAMALDNNWYDPDLANLHSNIGSQVAPVQVGVTNAVADLSKDGVDGSCATAAAPVSRPRKRPEINIFINPETRTHSFKNFTKGNSIYEGADLLALGTRGAPPAPSSKPITKDKRRNFVSPSSKETVLKNTKNLDSSSKKKENFFCKDYTKGSYADRMRMP